MASSAAGQEGGQSALAIERPCGPDNVPDWVRRFIPQGSHGADFRDSCRNHDTCYSTPGISRKECDDAWREDMFDACDSARKPRACRRRASRMYRIARRFGESAFEASR